MRFRITRRLQRKHAALQRSLFGPLWSATALTSRFADGASAGDTAQPAPVQGDIAQPAPAQGEKAQPAPAEELKPVAMQEGTPAEPEKGPVPYERLKEAVDARRAAEERANQYEQYVRQLHLERLQAQQARPTPNTPPVDPISEYIEREGIGKEGYVTAQDLSKVVSFVRQQSQKEYEQTSLQQQRQQWMAGHPDYVGLVVTPTGQYSEHLLKAIQKDPAIGVALQRNPDPALAYAIAERERAQSQSAIPVPNPALNPTPRTNPVVEQIKQAQRAPQSISAATGAAQLDRASYVANLSEADFQKHLENLKAGHGFVARAGSP